MRNKIIPVEGYEHLESVLAAAYEQASSGKGRDRHAKGMPFHEQRMQGISNLLESPDGMAYQAIKKVTEGMALEHDARERELLGAINYLAGMVIFYRRQYQCNLALEPLIGGGNDI